MDVKGTGTANQAVSITSMLVQVAIAKNEENRELLEKPVRGDSQQVNKADPPSDKSSSVSATEKAGSQPVVNNSAKIVDVSV